MNGKIRAFEGTVLAIGVTLALLVVAGCEKKQEPAPPQGTTQTQAKPLSTSAQETAGAAKEQVAEVIEQKTCPIMDGNPINKSLFVEYKGKKVYFCCAGCKEKFLAEPEKYIAKLPQFQQ